MKDIIKRHLFWIVPTFFFAGLGLVFSYHTSVPSWLGYDEGVKIKDKIDLLASILVGWGALFGIGIAAWRNSELNRQATAALQQAIASEKQQASEQLIEAVKLLARDGIKGTPSIEARIGALYNLEALTHTHPKDYGAQVMKTIAAYICENAQKTARDQPNEPDKRKKPSPLGKDVQTAFAVLKKLYDTYAHTLIQQGKLRRFTYMPLTHIPLMWIIDDIDFSVADFRKLNFIEVEWIDRPMLKGANFQGAFLTLAQLKGACLWKTQLQHADLRLTQLQGADLEGANLKKQTCKILTCKEPIYEKPNCTKQI
ncbi:MAG: pentapeptide repeat-containing protein [Alphaproteobacteria bacterium GM202ARS2]|nr:pentapeptide repeat-containing protein [Alphaproteobacteria bacterium GM202ARS2]